MSYKPKTLFRLIEDVNPCPCRTFSGRYHGVLAPNAADHDRIVPGSQEASKEGCSHA